MKGSAKAFITIVSIAIPVVVALLYLIPAPENLSAETIQFLKLLPKFNATINGCTAIILVISVVAIKNKKVDLHKRLMTLALLFSVLFLVSYVSYHLTIPSTKFGGEGAIKAIYLFILLTHILLSAVVVPLVLITYVRALSERFDKHRKIARITFPIWLYVALTGVIVYFLISPYY